MACSDASEDSAASEDVCPLSASSSVSPFVVLDFIVIFRPHITRQDGISQLRRFLSMTIRHNYLTISVYCPYHMLDACGGRPRCPGRLVRGNRTTTETTGMSEV